MAEKKALRTHDMWFWASPFDESQWRAVSAVLLTVSTLSTVLSFS
jgi:hypothetical protein